MRLRTALFVSLLLIVCGFLCRSALVPHRASAAPAAKVTVFDTTGLGTISVESASRNPATQFLTDGSIGSFDTSDSLGNHKTILYFNMVPTATTDNTTNGAQGSFIAYTFPEGLIHNKGEVMSGTISAAGSLTTTAAVVSAFGSVAAGVESVGTLGSTKADFVPQTTSTLTASVGTFANVSSTTALFDGTAAAKVMRVNFAIPDAGSSGAGTITMYGVATVNWSLLGDK